MSWGHGGARRGTCDTCRGVCWLAAVRGTFAATDCTIGYLQACATARLKTGCCKPTITTTFLCCQTVSRENDLMNMFSNAKSEYWQDLAILNVLIDDQNVICAHERPMNAYCSSIMSSNMKRGSDNCIICVDRGQS